MIAIEMIQMSKKTVTRFFVGAIVAVGVGLVLGFAALWAALAPMQSTSAMAST